MGICLSRRAMQADAAAEVDADSAGASSNNFRNRQRKAAGTEVDMINPARLLLESPRISTNEMGMLGMFFQKKYCKPLQHHQQHQHGYEKLTPTEKKKKAESELGLDAERASLTMMTANVLFEKDEYPTFEPNSRAAAGQAAEAVVVAVAAGRVDNEEEARRSKDSNAVNECSRGDQMWASAGEDFFSDWEDRSERGSSGIRGGSTSAGAAPEIGVFEAEQYFKEEPRASDGSCFYDTSNSNNNDDAESSTRKAEASRSSSELKRPSSSVAKSPSGGGSGGVGSGSGARWASSCAAVSAVQIDGEEAFVDHGRTLRRAKSKAELKLSKMFKLLGSSSSSSQAKHKPHNSMATTTRTTTGKRQQQQQHRSNENAKPSKSSKIRESHVKDWMDKARKSSDGIFALGQEDQDQQRCDQKPSSNNEQPQHPDPNLLPRSAANAADDHHRPLTPGVGFTFSGSTTDSSAAGALNESATSTHNQGFGSPFPASPNSDQKQQPEEPRIVVSAVASSSFSSSRDRLPARPSRPRPRPRAKTIIQQQEEQVEGGDVGNESDSSSDLFELDSVTTSLSSARSSLSRLSSARSSIRKSTADEQDLLHLQFCCDNKAVLAATLRANVLESNPAARDCNVATAENASSATKNHDPLRERVSSISLTDSQAVIGSSAAAAAAAGGITANEENKPPAPTSNRRAKSEILLSRHTLNARSVAPWNNSNGVLAVQT